MEVSPVVMHSLAVVGRCGEGKRGPACALCGAAVIGAAHSPDCAVRLALNFPGDLERSAIALEQAAVAGSGPGGAARCVVCLALPGLRHSLDCVIGHGLFTIHCLLELEQRPGGSAA